MAVLNLVHEILHSFGAEHDPAGIYIKLPIEIDYLSHFGTSLCFYRCKLELEDIFLQINMVKGQKTMEAVIS